MSYKQKQHLLQKREELRIVLWYIVAILAFLIVLTKN